jgi:hypothetical protein
MHLCLEDQIRLERILKYQDKINFRRLVQNEHMSLHLIQYLRQHGFEDRLSGSVMSSSCHMTLEFIKEHSFLDWDYDILSYCMLWIKNPSASELDILLHNTHIPLKWVYSMNLTLDHVTKHSCIAWNWDMLSGILPFDVIRENPDLQWNFTSMSGNSTLELAYVLNNPNKDWSYPSICMYNKNVEMIVRDQSIWMARIHGPDQEVNFWWYISCNKHVTIDIIKRHPHLQQHLNWSLISKNMPFKDIMANPNLPWDYASISHNPTLELDFVLKHPDMVWVWPKMSRYVQFDYQQQFDQEYVSLSNLPWDWEMLCMNKAFLHVSQHELEQKARQLIATNKIKRQFKQSISNPIYLMCQQRLNREFVSM